MLLFHVSIFVASCVLFYACGEWIVSSISRIARFLGWKKFIVSFFVMAFSASLPNLFIGVFSAVNETPELSFGDISGNNLIAMTLAVALAIFFSKGKKEIPAENETIQITSIFTAASAILPVMLILDGTFSRADGIIVILLFLFYVKWVFSRKNRFSQIIGEDHKFEMLDIKHFFKDISRLALGMISLTLASWGIIKSVSFFAEQTGISLVSLGIIIVSIGSALPEVYFSILSARKGDHSMILGSLMGAVIFPSTLVLGVVALIHPITIANVLPLLMAKVFLFVAAMLFLAFVQSNGKVSVREGFVLFGVYLFFMATQLVFGGS